MKILSLVVVLIFVSVNVEPSAHAAEDSDFFKGRTITITIASSMGGSFGQYAMLVGQYMPKHIPGNPDIRISPKPGAGGIVAANYAYNAMPRDGTGLLMPLDTVVIAERLNPQSVKYVAADFQWIGSLIQSDSILRTRKDSPVKVLADAKKFGVPLAATGKGSTTYIVPALANAVVGTRFKIVTGYRGSRGIQLAIAKRETDGAALAELGWARSPESVENTRPILSIGEPKLAEVLGVPTLRSLAKSEEDVSLVRFISSFAKIGRSLTAPPGVPKQRVAVLRQAFEEMLGDRDFQLAAGKKGVEVSSLPWSRLQAAVEHTRGTPDAVIKRLTEILKD